MIESKPPPEIERFRLRLIPATILFVAGCACLARAAMSGYELYQAHYSPATVYPRHLRYLLSQDPIAMVRTPLIYGLGFFAWASCVLSKRWGWVAFLSIVAFVLFTLMG